MEKIGAQPLSFSSAASKENFDGSGATELGRQFGNFLDEAMNTLQTQQHTVDVLGKQFASGQLVDIHNLKIASEKAALGLELTVQVRNKVIEAYQEIMRTQI